MVPNIDSNIINIGKNVSWTFLRTLINALFNSKQISSSKHISKMLLNTSNGHITSKKFLYSWKYFQEYRYYFTIFYFPTRPKNTYYWARRGPSFNNKKSGTYLDFLYYTMADSHILHFLHHFQMVFTTSKQWFRKNLFIQLGELSQLFKSVRNLKIRGTLAK